MKIIILFVLSGLSLPAAESQEFLKKMLEVDSLEQKGKVLETKWTLLQEQREQIKSVGPQKANLEHIFEAYINSLRNRMEELLGYMKGLRNENRIHKRTASKNEPDDVDNDLFNKIDLKVNIELLNDEINFLNRLCEAEIIYLKAANLDTSKKSEAKAASLYQDKIKELQTSADQQDDALLTSKKEISKLNRILQKQQTEIERVKNQIPVAEAQDGKLVALKDAHANLAELEAAQQNNERKLARWFTDYQNLLNVKITLIIDIDMYKNL